MSLRPLLASGAPSKVVVRGLSHAFEGRRVLEDVSFDVPAGAIVGFIGPNGAGKTTTLRVLATLLEPDEGYVELSGIDALAEPVLARRQLGFMPDGFGVYDNLTVLEYLDFFAGAHALNGPAKRRALEASFALTRLDTLAHQPVGGLSKGTRQRLALARTLLPDPEILVLDEPANGLDPLARIELKTLLLELQGLGKTIVISSHILSELAEMCTDLLVIERGNIRASGPIDAIARGLDREQGVRIELLEPMLDAASLLEAQPGVSQVGTPTATTYVVRFRGGPDVVARIVAALVGRGAQLTRVQPDADDLSRIFLEVTRGEIQ